MTVSVLIDLYPLRPDEVRTLIMSLALTRELSLGRMDRFVPYIDRLLAKELCIDENKRDQIMVLLKEINRVLWTDRKPWTLFDKDRGSLQGLLAHGLECQLLQDQEGILRVKQHLANVLNYTMPFVCDK